MQTSLTKNAARKTQDIAPLTTDRLARELDAREDRDLALAESDASAIDMHGYDVLPFTD